MEKEHKNIRIRKLQSNDYDEIVNLWDAADLPYYPNGRDSEVEIIRQLKLETSIYLVVEIDNRIAGVILGTHDGRKGWINRLAVHPDFQRIGIAGILIKEVEHRIRKEGIGVIACLIEDWNDVSLAFFNDKGYEELRDIIYFRKRDSQDI